MTRLFPVLILGLLVTASPAVAAPLPADVSHEPWFAHCLKLSEQRMAHFPDVDSHRISRAWHTDLGYLWDWENGAHASQADHTCVRLALYGKKGRLIENVTMLCTVTDRGTSTEVWTFGNPEPAVRLCPLDKTQLKEMDHPPKTKASKTH